MVGRRVTSSLVVWKALYLNNAQVAFPYLVSLYPVCGRCNSTNVRHTVLFGFAPYAPTST